MPTDRAEARRTLWQRYDAGAVAADEVEARLLLLDRAAEDDEAAIAAALDGPIPLRRRAASHRTAVIVGAVLLALALGAGVVAAAGGGGNGTPSATSGVVPGVPPPPGLPGTVATVAGVGGAIDAGCAEQDVLPAAGDAAANPSLLSDPAFVPEGYEVDDDDVIAPGTDPDLTMSVAAANPSPVEIRGRSLDGDLPARMRTWRYGSVEEADAAALDAQITACSYSATAFNPPEHPEINGAVVTGIIPTTAFAGWRLGERRFLAAVEAGSDDPEDVEEARRLATTIAVAELDAARNPPPAPAP